MVEQDEVATSIRINAKTKYFAQLVARAAGVSFAKLVEHLLDSYLANEVVYGVAEEIIMSLLMDQVWSEFESDRLALIADRFPAMLTEKERVIWRRIVCQRQEFWKTPLAGMRHRVSADTFDFGALRQQWPQVNKDADEIDRPRSEISRLGTVNDSKVLLSLREQLKTKPFNDTKPPSRKQERK